jgi:hypothetical protein
MELKIGQEVAHSMFRNHSESLRKKKSLNLKKMEL